MTICFVTAGLLWLRITRGRTAFGDRDDFECIPGQLTEAHWQRVSTTTIHALTCVFERHLHKSLCCSADCRGRQSLDHESSRLALHRRNTLLNMSTSASFEIQLEVTFVRVVGPDAGMRALSVDELSRIESFLEASVRHGCLRCSVMFAFRRMPHSVWRSLSSLPWHSTSSPTQISRQLSTIESVVLTRCALTRCALTHAQLGALLPLLVRCAHLKCVDLSHNRLGESRAAADWERLAVLVEVRLKVVPRTCLLLAKISIQALFFL